jgi:hypothetical protein
VFHIGVLGPVLFNLCIDICSVINHSKYLFFVDDTGIFHVVKSLDNCHCN